MEGTLMQREGYCLASGLLFPEGPAFAPDGSLWFVELNGKALNQLIGARHIKYVVGGKPNGIAIDEEGAIWFCDAERNEIRCFYPDAERLETKVSHVDGEALGKPNDLAFDFNGNLVFTCSNDARTTPTGYVCVLQKDGLVKKITEEKYFPNGLAFINDCTELIIAETYKHRLWKGKWDSDSCSWNDAEVFAETGGPIGPDGMAVDGKGNLHVAVYGSGKIKVIDKSGSIIDELDVPGSNPTNCAFDPTGKLGLVVTEAEKGDLLSFNFIV